MANRSRDFVRKMAFTKACRKKKIDSALTPYIENWSLYDNLHQYSKNKIHCSCPLCRAKTKDKNGYNYTIADEKKIESMNDDLQEYNAEEINLKCSEED